MSTQTPEGRLRVLAENAIAEDDATGMSVGLWQSDQDPATLLLLTDIVAAARELDALFESSDRSAWAAARDRLHARIVAFTRQEQG